MLIRCGCDAVVSNCELHTQKWNIFPVCRSYSSLPISSLTQSFALHMMHLHYSLSAAGLCYVWIDSISTCPAGLTASLCLLNITPLLLVTLDKFNALCDEVPSWKLIYLSCDTIIVFMETHTHRLHLIGLTPVMINTIRASVLRFYVFDTKLRDALST